MYKLAIFTLMLAACGGSQETKTPSAPAAAPPKAAEAPVAAVGKDGPETIKVPAVAEISADPAVIAGGEQVWTAKGCAACHKFGEKLVGPDLKGVFGRRSTIWVERMISEPSLMVRQDPQAKTLFATYMVEMTKQGVSDEEMPKLLAYIKAQGG